MTPPLQFLTITHKYVNVSTINQSKSRPVFRVVSSLDDINAQCLPENELVRDLQCIFPLMGGGNPEDSEPCSPSPVIFTVFWGILNNPAKLQSAVGNGLKTAINRGTCGLQLRRRRMMMLSNVSLGSLRLGETAEIQAISSEYFSHNKNTISLEKLLMERVALTAEF